MRILGGAVGQNEFLFCSFWLVPKGNLKLTQMLKSPQEIGYIKHKEEKQHKPVLTRNEWIILLLRQCELQVNQEPCSLSLCLCARVRVCEWVCMQVHMPRIFFLGCCPPCVSHWSGNHLGEPASPRDLSSPQYWDHFPAAPTVFMWMLELGSVCLHRKQLGLSYFPRACFLFACFMTYDYYYLFLILWLCAHMEAFERAIRGRRGQIDTETMRKLLGAAQPPGFHFYCFKSFETGSKTVAQVGLELTAILLLSLLSSRISNV